ncbi:MAG TPA: VOC family protein [Burkholderiales bacterium]|nr:VOC family protein [Burkholderiales bacterium]
MKSNPVRWFEIYVQDLARARKFYEAVFQCRLEKLEAPDIGADIELWAFPADKESFGSGGALVRIPGVPSGGMGTLVYFACEDCAVEEARAEKAGGRVEHRKMAIGPYGFISHVEDTEGNMIGLHSLR